MTYWVLFILAIAVITVFLLVAIGGFGKIEIEDDWENPNLADLNQVNLPISLFGYRRATVDKLLERLQAEKTAENPAQD